VPATILDGKAVAAELRAQLRSRILALRERGIHPRLVVLVAGEDAAGAAYARSLAREAEQIGVAVDVEEIAAPATAAQIRERLAALGRDASVHGVMLQQPLPKRLSIRDIADAIPRDKDVDGAHPSSPFVPATPAAVMLLLERSPHWPLRGRNAVVIGRSAVVGRPVAQLLLANDATVTVLHSGSSSLQPYLRAADVVVSATGVPAIIGGADIAPGATVVDVGTTLVDGRLVGDVDFTSAVEVAGAITPVPGGVGPMTIACLLRNTLLAACRRRGLPAPGV